MTLKNLADEAVAKFDNILTTPPTPAEAEAMSKAVENVLIKAVVESKKQLSSAAVICCGPEADLAHKITEELDRVQRAVITNLMSLR